jgi:hypothetical protein
MLILNFTYPLRCLRVPLGVRVPPVVTTALDRSAIETGSQHINYFSFLTMYDLQKNRKDNSYPFVYSCKAEKPGTI